MGGCVVNAERYELVKKMWLDEDFEKDFKRDWKAVYHLLKKGKDIPSTVLEMCWAYATEWEKASVKKAIAEIEAEL